MSRREIALKYFDENETFMNTTVQANIERYRKGDAKFEIVDENGAPVADAKITIKQKTHEFKYGANIFMLDELETDEKNQAYKDAFKQIFNIATIPFYWSDLEPEQGKPRYAVDSPKIYRRPPTDLCVKYCLENGIEPKAHCLNYDNFRPNWLKDADVPTHKKALDKHFRELAERYADSIPSWEVVNETLQQNTGTVYTSKFFKEDDFVEWSFKTADRYFPNNHLIINDFELFDRWYRGNRSTYYLLIERLIRNGVSNLHCIGTQYHCFFSRENEEKMSMYYYNPMHIYEVFDLYARFGKPLQITEITIPAYSSDEEDEEVQAELIEKLYTIFFSHPAMEAAIYWNLVDGYAAFAPQGDMTAGENRYFGGLMNFDLTKKKAFDVINHLFNEKWRTNTQVQTDENGKAKLRGFYGEYEVEVMHGGKTVKTSIYISKHKNNMNKIVF